jgi:homoserine O-acetyltransferase
MRAARPAALALALALGCAPDARVAPLGDVATAGGAVLRDCRLSYRTFGALDAARSNAVLVLPWFQGTSRELARQIGPGRLVDPAGLFVIAVDAPGNGVACSPSRSGAQPGAAYPSITIEDMVATQHALLTRELGIARLRAVVGVSMGGMQALAWAVEHPGFAEKVVAVVASPRTGDADRRRWAEAVAEVEARPAWRRAAGAAARLDPRGALWQLRVDPVDHRRQAEAIIAFDLARAHGGSLAGAAAQVRSRVLVVVSARDEVVDPEPARTFARLAGAELVVLDGRCGHDAPRCEREALVAAVRRFLAAPLPPYSP